MCFISFLVQMVLEVFSSARSVQIRMTDASRKGGFPIKQTFSNGLFFTICHYSNVLKRFAVHFNCPTAIFQPCVLPSVLCHDQMSHNYLSSSVLLIAVDKDTFQYLLFV